MSEPDLKDLLVDAKLTPEQAADIKRAIEAMVKREAGQYLRLFNLWSPIGGPPPTSEESIEREKP